MVPTPVQILFQSEVKREHGWGRYGCIKIGQLLTMVLEFRNDGTAASIGRNMMQRKEQTLKRILFLFVISFFYAGRCAYADSIQSFFNHDSGKSYTDPYYHQQRMGDNLEKVILDAVLSARRSIDIAVYEIDLPEVAKALALRKSAGVQIRIVLENSNSKPFKVLSPAEISALNEHDQAKYREFVHFADTNRDGEVDAGEISAHDSVTILTNAGIQIVDDTSDGSKGSGLMHHKFLIVDSEVLLTGSANFTRSCIHGDSTAPGSIGNANSLLKIESPTVIALFKDEFEELRTRHHFGLKKKFRGPMEASIGSIPVLVQFSPTSPKTDWSESTNGLISREILKGRDFAEIALFVFSEQKIVDSLETVSNLGLKPSLLIDPGFATRYYSELLDLFGIQLRDPKCRYEPGNHPWAHPSLDSGFPILQKGDLLHHKFAVIDHQEVIVGSHNWSDAANTSNDEALLVIRDPTIARNYSDEFSRLKSNSVLGPQPWLLKKIDEAEHRCGY